MRDFIPYQPVSFGPDINTNPPCDCPVGRIYKQPVQFGDITRFQLPNICGKTLGSELLSNGTFSSEDDWTQIATVGEAADWAIGGGIAGTTIAPDTTTSIITQLVALSQGNKYQITADLSNLNYPSDTNSKLLIIGVTRFVSDIDADWEILTEFDATAASTPISYTFIATKDYVGIGFAIKDSDNGDIYNLDNASLKQFESDECLTVVLRDSEENDIAEIPLTYYNDHIIGEVDWTDVDRYGTLTPGCYQICITEGGFFGNNLFTEGDGGTFETEYDGLINDPDEPTRNVTQGLSTLQYYLGDKSLYIWVDTDLPASIILQTEQIYHFKPNTQYTLSAYVWLGMDDGSGSGYSGDAYIHIGTDASVGTLNTEAALDCTTEQAAWKRIFITFTTGTTNLKGKIQLYVDSANTTPDMSAISFFVDEIQLYETAVIESSQCSQVFELKSDHGCRTILLNYTNDNDAYGFIYPEGFSFNMRLKGWVGRGEWDEEEERYEDSGGKLNLIYESKRKNQVLTINDAPEFIHDAVNIALGHQHIYLDDVKYRKIEKYTPKWRNKTMLCEGSAVVSKETQLFKNRIE